MRADRELLELAAKAARLSLWPGDAWRDMPHGTGLLLANGHWIWNPLTHDGDAFRLAVLLEFLYSATNATVESFIRAQFERDPVAATRRAIVRAAAEIGAKVSPPALNQDGGSNGR